MSQAKEQKITVPEPDQSLQRTWSSRRFAEFISLGGYRHVEIKMAYRPPTIGNQDKVDWEVEKLKGEVRNFRARDPWMHIYIGPPKHRQAVRRLAPDSGQVKLQDLPKGGGLEDALWRAMGREVANVHVPLGDVQTDLSKRNNNPVWLCKAAAAMADRIAEDWPFVYGPVMGSRGHHQCGGRKM